MLHPEAPAAVLDSDAGYLCFHEPHRTVPSGWLPRSSS